MFFRFYPDLPGFVESHHGIDFLHSSGLGLLIILSPLISLKPTRAHIEFGSPLRLICFPFFKILFARKNPQEGELVIPI